MNEPSELQFQTLKDEARRRMDPTLPYSGVKDIQDNKEGSRQP